VLTSLEIGHIGWNMSTIQNHAYPPGGSSVGPAIPNLWPICHTVEVPLVNQVQLTIKCI